MPIPFSTIWWLSLIMCVSGFLNTRPSLLAYFFSRLVLPGYASGTYQTPPHLQHSQPGPTPRGVCEVGPPASIASASYLPAPYGSFFFTVRQGHCTLRMSSLQDESTKRDQEVLNHFGILDI